MFVFPGTSLQFSGFTLDFTTFTILTNEDLTTIKFGITHSFLGDNSMLRIFETDQTSTSGTKLALSFLGVIDEDVTVAGRD